MPCRDYEPFDATSELREQNDRLARIACKAMEALTANGYADFLLLKDEEVREWWEAHQIADRKAKEAEERKRKAKEEKEELAKLKKDVLSRLSPKERKALGIKG